MALLNQDHVLEDFFTNWIYRHKVVATVEGGLKFQEAQVAWRTVRAQQELDQKTIEMLHSELVKIEQVATYHKAKHQEWLTAYQNARCKSVGDFTRMFVRRKRMRPLIRFLLSA